MSSDDSSDKIADLVEFFHHWSELRDAAISLCSDPRLESRQAMVLNWMIFIVDRVGPEDLGVEKGGRHD